MSKSPREQALSEMPERLKANSLTDMEGLAKWYNAHSRTILSALQAPEKAAQDEISEAEQQRLMILFLEIMGFTYVFDGEKHAIMGRNLLMQHSVLSCLIKRVGDHIEMLSQPRPSPDLDELKREAKDFVVKFNEKWWHNHNKMNVHLAICDWTDCLASRNFITTGRGDLGAAIEKLEQAQKCKSAIDMDILVTDALAQLREGGA